MQHPKSLFTVGALVIVAGVLAACQPKVAMPGSTQEKTSEEKQGSTSLMGMAAALVKGEGFRCMFTMKDTGQQMTYDIKGKKVSMTTAGGTQAQGQMGRMILDGSVMYMWDPATKKGMKMTIPSAAPNASGMPAVPNQPAVSDFTDVKKLEEFQKMYDVSCAPQNLSDSEFMPPADVQFQDYSAMMEQMQKMPAGMAVPSNAPAGAMY